MNFSKKFISKATDPIATYIKCNKYAHKPLLNSEPKITINPKSHASKSDQDNLQTNDNHNNDNKDIVPRYPFEYISLNK